MGYDERIKVFGDDTIEVAPSGKSCPPGFTGQAGNVSTVWFRVNGGKWELAARTLHTTLTYLEWAKSVKEFRDYVETFG